MLYGCVFLEIQRSGVDTVSKSCWFGAVVKDVAHVGATLAAADLDSGHACGRNI